MLPSCTLEVYTTQNYDINNTSINLGVTPEEAELDGESLLLDVAGTRRPLLLLGDDGKLKELLLD